MTRTKSVLTVVAVMVAALLAFAAPAMANDHRHWDWDDHFDDHGFFFGGGDGFGNFDQEAESGDVDQSFYVSGTGDNSNQTVGTQGVANTGNAQNQIGVTDFGNFDNDNGDRWWNDRWWNDDHFDNGNFEFDDVGSSIVVSPTNITSSDQEVNQAASAFGGRRW